VRRAVAIAAIVTLAAASARAQTPAPTPTPAPESPPDRPARDTSRTPTLDSAGAARAGIGRAPRSDSTPGTGVQAVPVRQSHALHLIPFIGGAVTSILAHESAHILASYAVGAHPTIGFDHGRPVIYSGIDADTDPEKQFIFSSAGLTVQTLLDEAILDVPHRRGSVFERGILAGGLGTTLFYLTVGRESHVGDVYYMARCSSLSTWGVTAIYGPIAALQVVRIGFNGAYAHFFAQPGVPVAVAHGQQRVGTRIGVKIAPAG